MPAKKSRRRQEFSRPSVGGPSQHLLHATVDVLEIATRYAGGSDQQGVASLLQLSAVNTAWCTAVGNVAAEELVARHCDVDVDDENELSVGSLSVLERYAATLDAPAHRSSKFAGVPPHERPLRLQLTFNQWYAHCPPHTALLLLATRSNESGRASTLRCIRALFVSTTRRVTPAIHRAFQSLLRILNGGGASLLAGLRSLRLAECPGCDAFCHEECVVPCPDVLQVLDTALDVGSIALLNVRLEESCTRPARVLSRVLLGFPGLRCLCWRGALSVLPDEFDQPRPSLEFVSIWMSENVVDGDVVASFVGNMPAKYPQLVTLSFMTESHAVAAAAFEELCVTVQRGHENAAHGPVALQDVFISHGWWRDSDVTNYNAVVTRTMQSEKRLLRDHTTLRSIVVPCVDVTAGDMIWSIAAADRSVVYGLDSLDIFITDSADEFRALLQQLPRLTHVNLRMGDGFREEALVSAIDALASFPGSLRYVESNGFDRNSLPLVTAFAAMVERHHATLRVTSAPWGATVSSVRALRHCLGLCFKPGLVDEFHADPRATFPTLEVIHLGELLRALQGDVKAAGRFLDNSGQARVHARTIQCYYGALPDDGRWLLLAAAHRCPNVTKLEISGATDPATFRAVLRALPRLRSLSLSRPLTAAKEHLTALAHGAAPQLVDLHLDWFDGFPQDPLEVRPPPGWKEALRSLIAKFVAASQSSLLRCSVS